mmetsp:Transcript_64710/g.135763  ORF Transcript_64710/g.135763 Transcript_64710/m.135763 type:complete len:235 (-) Transcript_64710:354-1058(-)
MILSSAQSSPSLRLDRRRPYDADIATPMPNASLSRHRPLLPVISSDKAFGLKAGNDDAAVRDFFVMAHRGCNPHESDFHMQARLGFRRPNKQKVVRLKPLPAGSASAADLTSSSRRKMLLQKHRQHLDPIESLSGAASTPGEASIDYTRTLDRHALQSLQAQEAAEDCQKSSPRLSRPPTTGSRPPSQGIISAEPELSFFELAAESIAAQAVDMGVESLLRPGSSRPSSRTARS